MDLSLVFTTLLACAVFFVVGKYLRQYLAIVAAVGKVKGPKYIFGKGTVRPDAPHKMFAFFRELVRKHPRMYRIYIGPVQPIIGLVHPDHVREVFNSSHPKATFTYKCIAPLLGDSSILITEGALWKQTRTLITPAFHFNILKDYASIANNAAVDLVGKFVQQAQGGNKTRVELFNALSLFTLDVVCQSSMSFKSNCQTDPKHPYANGIRESLEYIVKRFYSGPLHLIDAYYYRTSDGKAFSRVCDFVHSYAEEIIASRRKELQGKSPEDITRESTSGKRLMDFLDILLFSTDEDGKPLTNKFIRDQVDTFLFAGHDTSSSALAWLMYHLAVYPEIQDKCREEVDQFTGENGVAYDDLPNLTYLNAVICESMRMFPPVLILSRTITSDVTLDGITFPSGTLMAVPIYALHHNPDIWKDPEEFNPERFMGETTHDPFAFVPFSVGKRNCIGQKFAMNEIKITMCRILQKLIIEKCDHEPIPTNKIITRSENGIYVNFKLRQ